MKQRTAASAACESLPERSGWGPACGAPVHGGTLPHTVILLTATPSQPPSSDNVLTAIIAGTQKRRGEGGAPATVANYLADRAEALKPATLTRRLTAIGAVHEKANLQNPVHASIVRLTLAGIKREKGTRQTAKAPVRVEDLCRLMAMNVFHGLTGLRDRALLLLGFAAALRRSELANVRAEDLTFTGAGAVLLLPRSKADQQGKGTEIALPYAEDPALCPVRALMAWMSAAHLQQGPIFQSIDLRANLSGKAISPRTVAEIVKRYAARLGYDESQFSGHSLRRGFATEASRSGANLPAIMHHTRHKSERQALKYVEAGRNFIDSPLKRII